MLETSHPLKMSANNIFRFTGDLLHAASHGILIEKIRSSGSCTGISLKTQLLYGIVFSSRYFDLLWNFGSLYNTILKIYYLATTFYTIYLIAFKHADTYEQQLDKLPLWTIVVPSVYFHQYSPRSIEFSKYFGPSLLLSKV